MYRGGAYREVLEVREARALIGASAASQIGDWLYNAALLSYVYLTTGSAWWVGAATIVRLLPYVLLGPAGGWIADRYRRRTVLISGDLLRLALMLALAVVVVVKGPVEVVIALTAVASAAGTAERPAAIALLPRLVGEMRLGAANALLHTVQDLGVVVGPAIGALLLAVGPHWLAFAANAVTFAISATLVATIRDRSRPGGARDGAAPRVADRLRVAPSMRLLVPLAVVASMVELTYGAQTVQLVLYARGPLGLGAGGYGVLLAAAGAGGVISAVVNARLTMSPRIAFAIVASSVSSCAMQFVFAASSEVVLAILAAALGGAALVACEVIAETVITRIAPADTLGRLIGVFDSGMIAAMIAGALLAPLLVQVTSLRASFVILGAGAIGAALLGRLGLQRLDAANARQVEELAERVAIVEGIPITQGLPRLTTERIASSSQVFEVPAGVDVVVQGAPAHALYGIVDGTVMVRRNGADVVALGAGAAFGERGLLDNAPRNATVTTTSATRLLRIDGEALIEALQATPALRMALDLDAATGRPVGTPAPESASEPEEVPSPNGATVVVVGTGYASKRRLYERLHALGARVVIVDEPGRWSQALVDDGIADRWLPAPVTGDPTTDADAVLEALTVAGVRPDGVLTFWEDLAPVAARVARALGLPGNPVEAVDAARSKLRTRELSARLGLPTPRAVRVRSLDELYAAAADLGFPAVVKPEFGAAQMGCVRVDDFATLPSIYRLVRGASTADTDGIFRTGNDLLLEEYLDGVEFDVDLVMEDGECVFSSASQNWPTAEPSFQEQGLHCPPDHNRRAVRRVITFSIEAAQAFGLRTGVLHIEAKATSRGPRIVEINARMGGGRIYEMVRAVWDVDLVEAQLRASLGLTQQLQPSRRPRCAVLNKLLYAPMTGRLQALSLPEAPAGVLAEIDVEAAVGELVSGPDAIFATCLAEITLSGRNLADARALAAELLREPPVVEPVDAHPVAP